VVASFIRFVVLGQRDSTTGIDLGVFQVASALKERADVSPADRALVSDLLAWFSQNLCVPTRFNRSRSKGYYRRQTRGIAWFRETATEHLAQVQRLKKALERYGYQVTTLRETRVGYVVYEDDHQVIAEPFADTRME
jgi:hypothetical protein